MRSREEKIFRSKWSSPKSSPLRSKSAHSQPCPFLFHKFMYVRKTLERTLHFWGRFRIAKRGRGGNNLLFLAWSLLPLTTIAVRCITSCLSPLELGIFLSFHFFVLVFLFEQGIRHSMSISFLTLLLLLLPFSTPKHGVEMPERKSLFSGIPSFFSPCRNLPSVGIKFP